MSKLMTVTEIAESLNVNRVTVLRWLRSGKLVGVKTIGGDWRVSEEDVARTLHDSTSALADPGRTTEEVAP